MKNKLLVKDIHRCKNLKQILLKNPVRVLEISYHNGEIGSRRNDFHETYIQMVNEEICLVSGLLATELQKKIHESITIELTNADYEADLEKWLYE